MDEAELFETALAEDPAAQAALAAACAADPGLRTRWVAHARLAIVLRGRAPRSDLAARVAAVAQARRPSQRTAVARRVVRRVRPATGRWALAAAAAIAVVVAGALVWSTEGTPPQADPVATVPAPTWAPAFGIRSVAGGIAVDSGTLELVWADGSRAQVAPGSQVYPGAVTRLESGRMAVTVAPQASGSFRLVAGPAAIAVLGTRFTMDTDGDGTEIAVESGRVAVTVPGGRREVAAGGRIRATAGGTADRRSLWAWAATTPLRYGVLDPAAGLVRSRPHQEPPGTLACIAMPLDLTWSPAVRIRVRLHSTVPAALTCQIHRPEGWNLAATAAIPAGWSTREFPLEDLRPYQPRPEPQVGAHLDDLLFISDSAEPLTMAWCEAVDGG